MRAGRLTQYLKRIFRPRKLIRNFSLLDLNNLNELTWLKHWHQAAAEIARAASIQIIQIGLERRQKKSGQNDDSPILFSHDGEKDTQEQFKMGRNKPANEIVINPNTRCS